MAARAIFGAPEDVPLYCWVWRMGRGEPVNTLCAVRGSAAIGGLVTQAAFQGWLHLQDDEAVIIDFDPADAAYASVVLYDWWMRSIDPWKYQSSLTQAMIAAGPDGRCTTIVAGRDPSYAAWLDTGGLHDMQMIVRWQGLPATPVRGGPDISLRVVKFEALAAHLPEHLPRVTAVQRKVMSEERASAFRRRYEP